MANEQNLKPIQSESQAREMGRKGGIASGQARREKATMKAILEKILDEPSKSGRTYREMATLGLLKGAISGNANNYRLILETLGELSLAEEDRTKRELTKVEELLAKIEDEAKK